jgi:hypothetical protein
MSLEVHAAMMLLRSPILRRAARILAVLGVFSACAVGTGLDDGPTPDTSSGDGPDASADEGSPFDAAPAADASGEGASTGSPDTGSQPDTGGTRDTGAKDTGAAESGACSASGFSGALLKFDLSSQAGTEVTAAVTASANGVTGSALSRGGALTPTAGLGSINSSNWPTLIDPTRYYHFTVTPAAGCTVRLTTLAVDLSASGSGPLTADVATSADNFAAHGGPVAATGTASIYFSAVSGTGAIEVRIYGNGASSAAGTFRIQNTLTLSGTLN